MLNDILHHQDFYTDLFITHGGLFSKKSIESYVSQDHTIKNAQVWKLIKEHVLLATHTHDEVGERQPILAEMFKKLKLGVDIKPLSTEGDLLLRDFIVEVKQPSILSNSSISKESSESNDQQLLRAMKFRKKNWGILTNADEWQFFYTPDFSENGLAPAFISFSLLDMINDEVNASSQISLFINLLTSREVRAFLLKKSAENKHMAISSFSNTLAKIISKAKSLGVKEEETNKLVEFIFKVMFIFYCEDIGVLPRHSRKYLKCDLRKKFKKSSSLSFADFRAALSAFAKQEWSEKKLEDSGNKIFWDKSTYRWLQDNIKLLNAVGVYELWFDSEKNEIDMSEISSSDLCDVYQNCVHYESENVGTVYTSQGLSSYINSMILKSLKLPLEEGDVILDPACGSGHLLKRLVFVSENLLPAKFKKLSKSEMIKVFCSTFIAGIDKNPTAVFIAKINIWLSCAKRGESLDPLKKFVHDDTLVRFKKAYSKDSKRELEFLDGMGVRVKAVVSNPPWSMIFGNHPDKWISNDAFWLQRKENISTQDNLAFTFTYMIHELLDKDGVGVVILPGVFFVGSSVKVRDYVLPKITSYAPCVRNSDFKSIDSSQNYGIVCLKKNASSSKEMRVYTGLEDGNLTSFQINEDVFKLPQKRKSALEGLDDKFVSNSLLPLFSNENDYHLFRSIVKNSSPTLLWNKGGRGQKIKGEQISELKNNSVTGFFVNGENRGNSPRPIELASFSKANFDKCNEHVIKIDLTDFNRKEQVLFSEYFSSAKFNEILKMLRTSKSIRTAILNVIGFPSLELANLRDQMNLLSMIENAEEKVEKQVKKRKRATARSS